MSESKNIFLVPESEIKKQSHYRLLLLCGCFFVLLVLGLLNLYSASIGETYFNAQIKRMTLGIVAFGICGWFIPFRFFVSQTYPIYALTCISLFVVLILGYTAGGSKRWIHFAGFGIQPSEFAKISIALVVAKFFYQNRSPAAYRLRDLWILITLVALIFILIFKQPDLGTAGICLLIALSQIAFVRLDLRSLWIVLGSGLVATVSGWMFFLKPYQKLRILNLINPDMDPHGSGYNSIQSLVAIGSGGFWGKGFLQGTQTQLQFLPARHTDFVFSVFAEEWGFLGGFLIFALYGLLSFIILDIARHAANSFSALLAVGLGALIFIEFAINVAMVLGIFPVVGMPLPFFSYGGSSMIAMCIAIGMLVAIERHTMGAGIKKKKEGLGFTGLGFLKKKNG